MKKVTLLCGMLLALTASIASAAPGVNLKWNDCFGDGGATSRAFACSNNTGVGALPATGTKNKLEASFELGADLATVSGLEIVIDVATASAALPAWWQFKNTGACRQGSLGAGNADTG